MVFGFLRRKAGARPADHTVPQQAAATMATASQRERGEFLANRVQRFAGNALVDWQYDDDGERALAVLRTHTLALELESPSLSFWGSTQYAVATATVQIWSEVLTGRGTVRLQVASTEDMAAIHDLGRLVVEALVVPLERTCGREVQVEAPGVSAGADPQPAITPITDDAVPGVRCAATRRLSPLSGSSADGLPWQAPRSPEAKQWATLPTAAERLVDAWAHDPASVPLDDGSDFAVIQVVRRTTAEGEPHLWSPDSLPPQVEQVVDGLEPAPAGVESSEVIVLSR